MSEIFLTGRETIHSQSINPSRQRLHQRPYRGFKSSTIFLARLLTEQRRLGYNHSLYQCNIARALRHHPIHLLPEV